MSEQAWIAITIGVVIVGGCVTLHTLIGLLFRIGMKIYQTGESSGYRKSQDFPPMYADGPPAEDDPVDDIPQGEWGEDDLPESDTRVRVNMDGPRVAPQD